MQIFKTHKHVYIDKSIGNIEIKEDSGARS